MSRGEVGSPRGGAGGDLDWFCSVWSRGPLVLAERVFVVVGVEEGWDGVIGDGCALRTQSRVCIYL